ncbi:tetratricopeptide repeat protein [Soonwooa sp.]|uniref:tetratricopeptide repeat protein n=1 Tax=Soonwooa sp. TaxID=1938592 RepID=UPI0026334EEB|nr:tetratricopeptide repeat protein [Soonwooa sp.]
MFLILGFLAYGQKKLNQNEKEVFVSGLVQKAMEFKNKDGQKSILYIEDALQNADKVKNPNILTDLYDAAGQVYFSQEIYDLALKYYNEELYVMRENGIKKLYIPLKGIGNVYNLSKQNDKAKSFYQEALKELDTNKPDTISIRISNNLGVIEHKEKQFDKAITTFRDAYKSSVALKDTVGQIMSLQNIGLVYFELDDFNNALKNTFLAEDLAKKNKSYYDLAQINYNIGYGYRNIAKDQNKAKTYLLEAFKISNEHRFDLIKKATSEELAAIYESENDPKSALFYLHITKDLNDKKLLQQSKDQISILELKYRQKTKDNELAAAKDRYTILMLAGFVALVLLVLVFVLFYKLQQTKLKKRNAENELLITQLEEKNREITEKNLKAIQTREILDNTSKRLQEVKESSGTKTKHLITQIIGDLKNNPGRFNDGEFEKLFKETHEDFYKKLLAKYPDLTRNEIRLCAFLKMNLSSKEISAITQQSYNSITIARHRLRKKLGIDENQNLTNYLLSF